MKIPFTNVEVFTRSKPGQVGNIQHPVGNGESALRADLTTAQILRVNEQIRTFGKLREQVSELMESHAALKRSYDAGATTKFNTDFKGTYGTANTEIFSHFYTIWARARTIAKDTPQGKAIMRTHRNNIVGHNPFSLTMRLGKRVTKPHPKTGAEVKVFEADEDANLQVEQEWADFCQPENFTVRRTISAMEAANQMVIGAKTIGSVLIRLWRGAPNKYGFAVDLLESDRLQLNYQGRAPGSGNPIRGSIEYDPQWNYPVAYWILTRHPGEFVGQRNYPGGKGGEVMRERVPAENIIHFNNLRDRAEQDIGFTELDACIQAIWRLFQYQKALTYASISSCMKPFWIKKNYPTGMSYSVEDFAKMVDGFAKGAGLPSAMAGAAGEETQRQQGLQQRTSTETPGSTVELEYGLELMQTDPKFPIEAAHEFQIDNSKEIASAASVSYSDLTGDFQSLGYIAAQMSQRPSRDDAMVFQEHLIGTAWKRIFGEWVRSSILFGALDFPLARMDELLRAARFRGKRFPFTDELREVQALVLKLDGGIISMQQAQDLMPDGIDIAELVAQRSEYKQLLESYDLPTSDAPTTVTDNETDPGEPPVAGDGAEQPAAAGTPGKKKGSVTAQMQKSRAGQHGTRLAARDSLTRQLLGESLNGVH